MPVVGNLSEFPLPEILNLIGMRTGRMQLLDVPEAGLMQIDFWEGHIVSLYVHDEAIQDPSEVVRTLARVVQGGYGMFEFRLMTVEELRGNLRLPVTRIAMDLCLEVDTNRGRTRALLSANQKFVLVNNEEIWLDPELQHFFQRVRAQLAAGLGVKEAAEAVGMEPSQAFGLLDKLRQIGIVEAMASPEMSTPEAPAERPAARAAAPAAAAPKRQEAPPAAPARTRGTTPGIRVVRGMA